MAMLKKIGNSRQLYIGTFASCDMELISYIRHPMKPIRRAAFAKAETGARARADGSNAQGAKKIKGIDASSMVEARGIKTRKLVTTKIKY